MNLSWVLSALHQPLLADLLAQDRPHRPTQRVNSKINGAIKTPELLNQLLPGDTPPV